MVVKIKTPEELVRGWLSKATKTNINPSDLSDLGWEAGQVGYVEWDGMKWEKFYPEESVGDFIVISWDDEGNICIN